MMVLLAVSMTAFAQESKKDITYKDGENDDWTMQLGVGVNLVTGAPGEYEFAPFKSWDIQWTLIQYNYTPKGAKQTYSIGLGLNWRNYGLKDNNTAFVKVNDVVGLGTFPANASSKYSSVRTLGIIIPILFTQDLGKDFSFSVGPVVNFNGTHINNHYSIGDDEYDVKTHKIGTRPVTVDILGILSFRALSVYCKYSPMSVLKNSSGMEFKSVSFGICF